jgi:8-oxo-dGTP diphosphatase
VEPGEPPWVTVVRQADEELGIVARPHPLTPDRCPLFLTVTQTFGPHSHLDCTLWWVLDVDRVQPVRPDRGEFSDWGWFLRHEVAGWPAGRTDPEMTRMLRKLDLLSNGRSAGGAGHADG